MKLYMPDMADEWIKEPDDLCGGSIWRLGSWTIRKQNPHGELGVGGPGWFAYDDTRSIGPFRTAKDARASVEAEEDRRPIIKAEVCGPFDK